MRLLVAITVLTLVELSTQQQTNYCDARLCRNHGPHIACNGLKSLAPSCGSGSQEVTLDGSKQALIVDLHNQLRSKVASGEQVYSGNNYYQQASRMATLQWDPELASIAAANAKRCVYGHDKCRATMQFPYAGQNIAMNSYYGMTKTVDSLIREFINGWYSEYKDANPSIIASYPEVYHGPAIGHFTQIVSDRTTRIGCSLVSYKDGLWTKQYFVCNYGFTNILGQPVYVSGYACSRCSTGCNAQYPGLCNVNESIRAMP